jgi:hypothetical protein
LIKLIGVDIINNEEDVVLIESIKNNSRIARKIMSNLLK